MKVTTSAQHEPIVNIVKVPTNPSWEKQVMNEKLGEN